MKNLAALILILLLPTILFAQHGNEWIDHQQVYVKIPVAKNGIYRLTNALLNNAGFPTNIDPRNLQLYHRGAQQPLIVAGEEDGIFDGDDYVEFYGRKNDGTLDTKLYEDPSYQPHQYYNLFNDTTFYFLTVGAASGERMSFVSEPNIGYPDYTYHVDQQIKVLSEFYAEGRNYRDIIKSTFDEGEGFMGKRIIQNGSESYTISNIQRMLTVVGNPSLELQLTGLGEMNHTAEVYVGAGARLLFSRTINNFESVVVNEQIQWSDIDAGGNLIVKVMVKVANDDAARVSVNYIKMRYPQMLDMNNLDEYDFTVPANGASRSFLQISNAPGSARIFDVTSDDVFELATWHDGMLNTVVTSEDSERKLYATDKVITPAIVRVTFREIDPEEYNYIIISHRLLRKPGGGYADPVKAYAAYRASAAGGEHDTLVVNIDDVYNQFSYGEQTPLAIFNFMSYLASGRLPDYLFLIGKGLDVNYNYFRNPSSYPNYKNLIPSAGMPASDAAFTEGLDGSIYRATVSTGRISAMKPEQVAAYLNKVIEKEGSGFSDLRKKNLLHLSGGIHTGEPQAFRAYLEAFSGTAEGIYLGGKVDAIAKQSTDIKLLNIAEEVNAGLNLITFFGHSSPGTIDFDIGYVTDDVLGYHNKGKYPMLLMNGCQAGAFQLNSSSATKAPVFGEDWINATDRGAVGFIAHSSYGFVHLLRKYSGIFYDVAFGDSVYLAKGVGDVQREVAARYLEGINADEGDITQVQQMMLLGDPAVSLFGAAYPDYNLEDENISLTSLDENPVTSYSDSFAISFIVRNYGQARNKALHIQVKRTYGNRQIITYDSTYSPLMYADTLTFIIRGENKLYFGNNTFEIRIDANNEVTELDESNNVGYLDYFLPLNGTNNLFPRRFGIVSSRDVNLTFQHSDILSSERAFMIEVDTLNTFDSPYKKTFNPTATVLARQEMTLLENDSLVYYWRTKIEDPGEFESTEWTTNSFTYISDGPEGWSQSHFPQYLDNTTSGLNRDTELRLLEFEETSTSVFIRNYGVNAGKPLDSVSLKINGEEFHLRSQGFGCRTNTINLVAFDKISTAPYLGVVFNWATRAGRTCGREPWVINSFRSNELVTGNNDDLIQYIDNVSAGDSVILFSIGNPTFSTWPQAARDKLKEIGIAATQLQALINGEPVVILGRKGAAEGTATFIRSSESLPLTARLKTNVSITGSSGYGKMTSALVGPAVEWYDIDVDLGDLEEEDSVSIDVIGIKLDGTSEVVLQDIQTTTSIGQIDAATYPQLRLALNLTDTVNLTAPQLRHWIVSYEPVAEGLVIYNGLRTQETLPEGAVWNGDYGFINVSDREFPEQLSVSFKVFNHESLVASHESVQIESPLPGDTAFFSIPVNTFKKVGLNDVEVDVNPGIYPEHSFENNLFTLTKHLNVINETFNPVLDVTVDGRYIENEEFVSARPRISISLWDENRYLIKTDTTGISIFLAYPCEEEDGCDFTRINFTDARLSWSPATDTSDFKVSYLPDSLADGRYILLVEASDESGNPSGAEPYEIAFQVASETFIEVSSPYPNPATDQLRVALNLTGVTLPEKLTIRLVDVNGKVIGAAEKSGFHYGRNVISFQLEDLSSYRLLPGLYVYEIMLSSEGRTLKNRGKLVVSE
jgi:hypothetical protein